MIEQKSQSHEDIETTIVVDRGSEGENDPLGHQQKLSLTEADLPAGIPKWITPELVEETIRVWSPYYGHTLKPDEAVKVAVLGGELMDALYKTSCPISGGREL